MRDRYGAAANTTNDGCCADRDPANGRVRRAPGERRRLARRTVLCRTMRKAALPRRCATMLSVGPTVGGRRRVHSFQQGVGDGNPADAAVVEPRQRLTVRRFQGRTHCHRRSASSSPPFPEYPVPQTLSFLFIPK